MTGQPSRLTPQLRYDDTDHRAICGHHPPGGTRCQNPAETHLFTESHICVATCQTHHRIAQAAAPYIDEHEHRGLCGLPGTAWSFREKQCVIDDSGQEPELRMLEPAMAARERTRRLIELECE